MVKSWFEVIEINKYIILIRERLDRIEPRYLTKWTNIFIIKGSHSAILFDTGSGLQLLKPIVNKIIKNLELIVINSHHHFDHILSNYEFDKVHIHELEVSNISGNTDVSHLKVVSKIYSQYKYSIPPSDKIIGLNGDELFDLGGLTVKVLHTPGHTPGSICLFTSLGDLFSGDTIHYGSIYLPAKDKVKVLINTLKFIGQMSNVKKIYPSHEEYTVNNDIIYQIINEIMLKYPHKLDLDGLIPINIGIYDEFLDAHVIIGDRFNLIY